MKGIYWRPRYVSRWGLTAIALAAVGGLAVVEHWPWPSRAAEHDQMLAAAQLAARGMDVIQQTRQRRGDVAHAFFDPAQTGMIGASMSLVTSVPGNLRAKQTSVNPNFAAAVVRMLRAAGVREGDCVAVGCSGSFPALNLSVYAALQTLRVKPLVVASVGSSQFGANLPDLLWIDMERLLYEQGVISFRSLAASPGGFEDQGLGFCPEALRMIEQGILRNGLPLLEPASLEESIEQRMAIYRQAAGPQTIAAYVNVGGGAASAGHRGGKRRFRPGLNPTLPRGAEEMDSIMTRFSRDGAPVIHLLEVNQLAQSLGFPEAPPARPPVGQGGVFQAAGARRWPAAGLLLVLLWALRLVVYTDAPARLRAKLLAHDSTSTATKLGDWMV